jgi:hypothetical protein
MRIEIKAIDPSAMRYSEVGDWRFLPDGTLQILVTDYGSRENDAFLIALSKMVEAWLCRKDGITEEQVTEWQISTMNTDLLRRHTIAPNDRQNAIAKKVTEIVREALGVDPDQHRKWVNNCGDEIVRSHASSPATQITKQGSRHWAELHLYALRYKHNSENHDYAGKLWFLDWSESLPFDGCPCQEHFRQFISEHPPVWQDLFGWSVHLHNDVNERIGKPAISVEKAREAWEKRTF